ncbi:MAG: peptidoglycan-binding protein [Rhodospirillaceae bacterium]|nr:peptidoglycan-binding protein [Rhodospirillales bacterium]
MKTSTLAVLALGALATAPAWAQQSSSGNPLPYPSTTQRTLDQSTYLSPGQPLAAAETTQAYVPNSDVVMAVEQRLAQLGYNVQPDGQYDANLNNNVLLFQSDHGLRPTGNVDLATIGALGINVEPRGMSTAQSQSQPAAVAQQTAQLPPAYNQIMERSEHMSAPQTRNQAGPLESTNGIELSPNEIQVGEQPPAFPPGFPTEDLYD